MVELLIAVLLVQFSTIGSFAAGWVLRGKFKTKAVQVEEEPTEAERKKLEKLKAEDEAFTAMLGYNIETAYGMNNNEGR